jgi:hypothetical protein
LGFCKAAKIAKSKGVFDIGIVGIPTVGNFGGALTYFGLYNAIKDMGFSVLMIERPTNSKHPPGRLEDIYCSQPYSKGEIIQNIENKEDFVILNKKINKFIVGSDQLFHHNLLNNFSKFQFLDWVYDSKRKIAYAASFGHDTFTGDEEERAQLAYYLNKFDAFSVREETGKALAKEDFNIESQVVIDPIFLCDFKKYEELAKKSEKVYDASSPYISAYILDPNSNKEELLLKFSSKLNMKLNIFSEMFYTNETIKKKWNLDIEIGKIEDRLSNIFNSQLLIADSFHGICIAIIFKKDFIAINNKNRGATRFENILKMLGLKDRLVEQDCMNKELFIDLEKINYVEVYEKLERQIQISKNWLESNIKVDIKKGYSTYDILKKEIEVKYRELFNKMKYLSTIMNFEYIFSQSFIEYTRKINEEKENLIIVISSKDTPGMSINAEMMKELSALKIKSDLINAHWCGFVAIIFKGNVIFEDCKFNESVYFKGELDSVKLEVLSSPLKAENLSNIIINNNDYSLNLRGLNFVVYDLRVQKVSDRVNFDTHDRNIPCYRTK